MKDSALPPLEAAVLAPLLSALQLPAEPGALAQACRQGEGRSPVDALREVLSTLKIRARAAQMRWDRFDRRQLPALVLHESVWYFVEVAGTHQVRLTPAVGAPIELDGDALGTAPVLWLRADRRTATEHFDAWRSASARLVMRELMRSRQWLADVVAATLVVNLLAVTTSLFAMQVYDRVVPSFAYATLTALVIGMVIVVALDWTLKILRARILDVTSKRVDLRLSQTVFEHLMSVRLDLRPPSLGTLTAQVNALEPVRGFFSSSVVFAVADLPFVLMFIVFIAIIGGPLAWVYATLLLVAVAVGWFTQGRLRALARDEVTRGIERQGLLMDTLRGAESIQSGGLQWRFGSLWREIGGEVAAHSLKSRAASALATTTMGSLSTVAYISAVVVGVSVIEQGELTIGGLIACSILGGRVLGPVAQAMQILVQWQHVRESLQLVDRLLDLEAERRPQQDTLLPGELRASLSFEGVRFAYPNTPLLRMQTAALSFAPGERVALLGGIGSGKSTLLKLGAALYKPSEGQVKLGGADLWELDPQVVHEHVAYLPQDVHLFKGSLRSNLALAGRAGDRRMLDVCEAFRVDSIASDHPRGFDQDLHEGGQGLSGGQRQLVALARMFMVPARIWLLDEPTASLDRESEQAVIEGIRRLVRPDDLVILSTHRPRLAAAFATRVVMLRRGQVVADGPAQDILQRLQGRRAVTET